MSPRRLKPTASKKWCNGFWTMLFILWIFSAFALWDYGFTAMFDGLSLSSIIIVLTEVVRRRGAEPVETHLTLLRLIKTKIFTSAILTKFVTAVMMAIFFCLFTLYVVLPPLKSGIRAEGVDTQRTGLIQIAIEREPQKLDLNAGGYGFVRVPGLNSGSLPILAAYSSQRVLAVDTTMVNTTFLWKHRFESISGPIVIKLHIVPSAAEQADQCLQQALDLAGEGDYQRAIDKIGICTRITGIPAEIEGKLQKTKVELLKLAPSGGNNHR